MRSRINTESVVQDKRETRSGRSTGGRTGSVVRRPLASSVQRQQLGPLQSLYATRWSVAWNTTHHPPQPLKV
jgi:hypothetical protein